MTDNERIEWQLEYIRNHGEQLSPGNLDWAIRMEEAYEKQGFLTEPQQEVLTNICGKC